MHTINFLLDVLDYIFPIIVAIIIICAITSILNWIWEHIRDFFEELFEAFKKPSKK